MESKVRKLFIVLGAFFVTNALMAEFIGVKLFSLEDTLGLPVLHMHFFGFDIPGFNMTAGVLLWPFVFVLTDIINEYFGQRGVRLLSWLVIIMIGYAYLAVFVAIRTVPSTFWIHQVQNGIPVNMEIAFNSIFGQGQNIIFASLVAFLISQLSDVFIFHQVRRITGPKRLWLRSTGSTLVSQLIDSFVVLMLAFHWAGPHWPIKQVLAIGFVNYIYKFFMAIAMTPIIYLVHFLIERYLGKRLSRSISEAAARQ